MSKGPTTKSTGDDFLADQPNIPYYSKWIGKNPKTGATVTRHIIERSFPGNKLRVIEGHFSGYRIEEESFQTDEEFRYWVAMHGAKCVERQDKDHHE